MTLPTRHSFVFFPLYWSYQPLSAILPVHSLQFVYGWSLIFPFPLPCHLLLKVIRNLPPLEEWYVTNNISRWKGNTWPTHLVSSLICFCNFQHFLQQRWTNESLSCLDRDISMFYIQGNTDPVPLILWKKKMEPCEMENVHRTNVFMQVGQLDVIWHILIVFKILFSMDFYRISSTNLLKCR